MGITQDLRVAGRRWAEARKAPSAKAGGEQRREELRRWFSALRSTHIAAARSMHLCELEASQLPWLDTGIDLKRGECVSTFAAGRVVLSNALDIWVGPQFQLWMRVGETGTIFNGSRDTHSFRAETAGRLYFGNCLPGQWGDTHGRVSTSLNDYSKAVGGISIAVIRWIGDAEGAVARLAGADAGGWFAAEARRFDEQTAAPAGWDYLWFLGRSEIFRPASDEGRACIACHTHENVAILQRDAVFDLEPGTRLRWSWKVDELPSVLPENTAASHDYLSIAVEFENGRDITYTWSPELPVGTGYWCPLATWKDREFHVVVRSGSKGLGTWLEEQRDLHADYVQFMGEAPKRIVRVWLIAVSMFQRRTGRAFFHNMRLEAAGEERRLELD